MMGGRPSATCVVIQLNGLWRRPRRRRRWRRRCVSVMIDFPSRTHTYKYINSDPGPHRRALADYRARRDHLLNNFSETNIDSRTQSPSTFNRSIFEDLWAATRTVFTSAHARGVKNLSTIFMCVIKVRS